MRIFFRLVAVAIPGIAAAQAVPTRTLATPDAEWSEPFSLIIGIRELKNGRVIVADNRDKVIQLIDFKGEAKKIGREGSGPAEYGLPSAVYAAPGDSTWVYDPLNSRYLVIDPAGKAVSTFMTQDAGAAAGPQRLTNGPAIRSGIGMGFAQGIDAMGRLYFRAPTISFANGVGTSSDTMPILRWDRKTGSVDTVGVLVNPPASQAPPTRVPTGGGNAVVSVRIGNSTPFGSSDSYVVTPRGDVAVVRARDQVRSGEDHDRRQEGIRRVAEELHRDDGGERRERTQSAEHARIGARRARRAGVSGVQGPVPQRRRRTQRTDLGAAQRRVRPASDL
jgi:hypothetical protein